MRKIFLLKGPPGSGKSTLVASRGLQDLTVSLDDIRQMYSPELMGIDRADRALPSRAEKRIQEIFESIILHRMDMGSTIFVDNTNISVNSQKKLARLGERFGYETIVVDVLGDLSLEEVKRRNQSRSGWKIVPDEIVEKMYSQFHSNKNWGNLRQITVDELDEELVLKTKSLDDFDQVVVIGDVQSCDAQLQKLVTTVGTNKTYFIFTGDMFDRGPNAYGVFNLIQKLGKNVSLVMGNHDEHIYRVLQNPDEKRYLSTRQSVNNLIENGVKESSIRRYLSRFVPVFDFSFANRRYVATHAGIIESFFEFNADEELEVGKHSDIEFIHGARHSNNIRRGIGDYDHTIDELLSQNMEEKSCQVYDAQFHGHRNSAESAPDAFAPSVFSLESKVENGGCLSAILLSKSSGYSVIQVQ